MIRPLRFAGLAVFFAGIVPPSIAGEPGPEAFFEAEVRPVLVERCLKCHGGDGKPKGGLRLDSRSAVLKGGDGGPAALVGKPDESAIVQAIRYQDEPKMPPAGKLPDREIAALTRWVEIGLPWPDAQPASAAPKAGTEPQNPSDFWSFRPVRPVDPPEVRDSGWPRTEIDRFLLAALEAKGLKPAPEAEKRTLIRRVTFDLIGLPPTPAEVEAFLKDESPDAFARVVDRLLGSPRYGERWARHWLDLVRYADSLDARGVGGEGDIREAWRYRDWVVDALNRDLPYDQFLSNQIAGDLLPSPNPPSEGADDYNAPGAIASTMLAIGNWGNGDADKEKILTDIADDQVDVVSRAFLGLTVACARCHDHKFDPISQKDYYGLAGIFFSTHILDRLAAKGEGERIRSAPLASKAELQRRDDLVAKIAQADRAAREARDQAYRALAATLRPEAARYLVAAWDYRHQAESSGIVPLEEFARARGLQAFALRRWADLIGLGQVRALNNATKNKLAPGVHAWERNDGLPSSVANTTDAEVAFVTFRLPPRSISVHPGPTNPVVVSWRSPISGSVRVSGKVRDADPVGGDGVEWAIEHVGPSGARPIASADVANGGKSELASAGDAAALDSIPVRPGDVVRLVIRPKSNHGFDMTTIDLVVSNLDGSATWDLTRDLLPDFVAGNPHADGMGHPRVWALEESLKAEASDPELNPLLVAWRAEVGDGSDRPALERASANFAGKFAIEDARSPFWIADPADVTDLPEDARSAIARTVAEAAALKAKTPGPLSFANSASDGGVPGSPHAGVHDVKVHIRGRYDRLGDLVPRHFPTVLAGPEPPAIREGSGRVELARWLSKPENPLTARVLVNRVWQHHFGEGIVRTPSNFGKLGDRPSHPELLDWLAARFVADGFSIKKLHRLILLSAAYRQSSAPSAEALRLDADNRLISRMPRVRLESEAIRDALLAASGRLDLAMGGPSTQDPMSPRRTLYLMMIRSTPYPFAPLFDAADPTGMVEKRTASTVAPQALYLLNNPFVIDQAAGLASRILGAGLADDRARIDYAYKLLYSRPATEAEAKVGLDWLADGGGQDAWASYCQVLACGNEFLYID